MDKVKTLSQICFTIMLFDFNILPFCERFTHVPSVMTLSNGASSKLLSVTMTLAVDTTLAVKEFSKQVTGNAVFIPCDSTSLIMSKLLAPPFYLGHWSERCQVWNFR